MKTNIMGTAVATVQQMQSYIQKVNPAAPKSVIDMVEYYISEGKTEGVRGDIAFAQSCLETGNFTFNGSAVTLDQNNFAGIGVTKNGMKGNSFSHPWIGIRAQIQHLKAYASNEKLYGVCVDPRFCYVKRGIAPYVEWLGIQENPQGGGWAAGKNYGSKILEILAKIIAMPEANKEDVTMNLNTSLISNNNSYANQVPKYIVIHNTDNFAKGASPATLLLYMLMIPRLIRLHLLIEAHGMSALTMVVVFSEFATTTIPLALRCVCRQGIITKKRSRTLLRSARC